MLLGLLYLLLGTVSAAWLKFRRDEWNSGLYETPQLITWPRIKWTISTASNGFSSPVLSETGNLYVGSKDSAIYAVNNAGSLLWRMATNDPIESTLIVREDFLFAFTGTRLLKLHTENGSLVPSFTFNAAIPTGLTSETMTSSPAYLSAQDAIVFGSRNSHVYAVAASGGSLLWSFQTKGPILSSPAIQGGAIFMGSTDGFMYSLAATTGSALWCVSVNASIYSSAAIGGGHPNRSTVFFGADGGSLTALSAATGELLWTYRYLDTAGNVCGQIRTSPAISAAGNIYFGCSSPGDALYFALTPEGSLLWKFHDSKASFLSSAAVGASTLYVGCNDNFLYALDLETGAAIWSFDSGGNVFSSPVMASNGDLYVGSNAQSFYVLTNGGKPMSLIAPQGPLAVRYVLLVLLIILVLFVILFVTAAYVYFKDRRARHSRPQPKDFDVYFSYLSADNKRFEIIKELAVHLSGEGLNVIESDSKLSSGNVMLDWLTCALLGGEHDETECRVWQSRVAVVFLSKEYMINFFGKGESQVRHEMQAALKPKQKVAIIFCFLDNDENTLAALDDGARTDDRLAEILSRAQILAGMYLKFEKGCDQVATKEKLFSEVVCKFRKEQFCIYDYHVVEIDYERIKKIKEVLVEKDPTHKGELIILTDPTRRASIRRGTGNANQPSEKFRTEAMEKLKRAKVVITFITEDLDKKMAEAQAVDRGAQVINLNDVTAMQLVELRRQVRENNVPPGGGCLHRAECCVAAVLGSDDLFKWAESEELKLWTEKRTKYGVGTRLFHFPPLMTEKDHKRVAEDMAGVLREINNSLYTTDCFLSHDWKTAGNHDKVKEMHKFFREREVVSWIDEEGMKGSLNQAMSSGIAGTKIFIVFLTPEYQTKVNAKVVTDNVFKEFSIASMKRDDLASKDLSFLFVSMDPSMDDPAVWAKGLLKSTYQKKKSSGEVAHIIKYKNTAELQKETFEAVRVILEMPEDRRASWVSSNLSQKRSSPGPMESPSVLPEDPTPNPLQFSGELELGPTTRASLHLINVCDAQQPDSMLIEFGLNSTCFEHSGQRPEK